MCPRNQERYRRDKRKVLIFSYFADTVEWITDFLNATCASDDRLSVYEGRIASVTGRRDDSDSAMFGFAPRTTDPPAGRDTDRFDIVVTTDVLAEGVNLQQARHIVNYDLPWNPMRLVQRHGRVDRIGSRHAEVFLRCIYPDRQLEALLSLEERLQRKLRQAMVTFGGDTPLPGSTSSDINYADDTRSTLDAIRRGDNELFITGGGTVLGEEFRQLIRVEFGEAASRDRVKELPWGSGSGFAGSQEEPAWVFCARIGDHPEPRFAHVTRTEGGFSVDTTQLRSLLEARPPEERDTVRSLPSELYVEAFAAWEAAQAEIFEAWEFATDPANLEPKIPAVLERAIELVRAHYQGVLSVEEADTLVDRLRVPYPERLLRPVRQAIADGEPAESIRELVRLADELGFSPASRQEPLPPINQDDVHLVCWMSIAPEGAGDSASTETQVG